MTHLGDGSSLLLLGYKLVQHVTALNTVGDCNTTVFMFQNISKHRKGTVKIQYEMFTKHFSDIKMGFLF